MARSRIETDALARTVRPAGDYPTAAIRLSDSAYAAQFTIERHSWPTRTGTGANQDERTRDAEVARLEVQFSPDNGVRWFPLCAMGMPGGALTTLDDSDPPQRVPLNESTLVIKVPGAGRPSRAVRARLRLRNGLEAALHVDELT